MAEKKNDILIRGYLVFAGFVLFGLAIIARVGYLQIAEGEYWKSKKDSLTLSYRSIPPMRGNIYASDGSLLATSLPRYDVHVDLQAGGLKKDLFNEKVDSLALCLSDLFKDKSKQEYKRILKEARREGDRYLLLKRNISYKEQKALRTFPLFRLGKNKGGLIVDQLSRREKPFKLLASRTIGYKMANKEVESVGIESAFDSHLRGTTGKRLMQRIAGGVWKPVNTENEIEPLDGSDVVTTIDLNLQDVAENALLNQLREHDADMGCAILMEVSTGHIKAIANLKRADDEDNYKEEFNYAIGQGSEPGSTFKLATLMAAMEDGYVDLDDSTDTFGGEMLLAGGIKMRDSHEGGYGRVSVKKAFAVSSNVGISRIAMKHYSKNPQLFIDRLKAMHVADQLSLQIPGEPAPRLKGTKEKDWSKVSLPFISIGYESKLTPLQLLTFYNAVANNGKMVQPLFVKEIRNKGHVVQQFSGKVIAESICSPATIKKARQLLEEVVTTGTASHIKHAQYTIAGKTGTAQIAQGKDGYKTGKVKYQASFCGYFPADNPRYSCIVMVYAPGKDVYYGASIACPVFKEIADKAFALDTEMHKELESLPDSLFAGYPVVKPGRAVSASLVARNLEVKYKGPSNGWVSSAQQAFTPDYNKVPNVKGMGLRDAMYLLENQGLQVKPIGRGAVIRQSIQPGTKLEKGQRIIIELG
ncbi:MAG: transpeptidase family protein [Bacteroidetes bacterium]|nr:transpeptidase family protein [Bacteroidota bacterium]